MSILWDRVKLQFHVTVMGTCEWDKKGNYPLHISMAFKQISTQNKDCHQKGFNFTVDW